jgi:8-oxo-dGTP diphosphatase
MQLAGCIIKNKENKVLLMHRKTPNRSQWEIPGGKVEIGEIPTQTAVRELREELGIGVALTRQIGAKTFEEEGQSYEYFWFEAEIHEGTPYLAEPDTFDNLQYLSLDEMERVKDDLSANTKNYLDAIRQNEVTF